MRGSRERVFPDLTLTNLAVGIAGIAVISEMVGVVVVVVRDLLLLLGLGLGFILFIRASLELIFSKSFNSYHLPHNHKQHPFHLTTVIHLYPATYTLRKSLPRTS